MRVRKAGFWVATASVLSLVALGVVVVGGMTTQPASAIQRCPAEQCKDYPNCQPSGIQFPVDTGLTECFAGGQTISCSGGETVHGTGDLCSGVAGCMVSSAVMAPWFCD